MMQESLNELNQEQLRIYSLDSSLFTQSDALVIGEAHNADEARTLLVKLAPDLAAAGFKFISLEGVPAGVTYDGTVTMEEFVETHHGRAKDRISLINALDAMHQNGITLVGSDWDNEEANTIIEQAQVDITAQVESSNAQILRLIEGLKKLLPILSTGFDPESDESISYFEKIGFDPEDLAYILPFLTNPKENLGELVAGIEQAQARSQELLQDILLERRNQIMSASFLATQAKFGSKGIQFIGLEHARREEGSFTDILSTSGLSLTTAIVPGKEYSPKLVEYIQVQGLVGQEVAIETDTNRFVVSLG